MYKIPAKKDVDGSENGPDTLNACVGLQRNTNNDQDDTDNENQQEEPLSVKALLPYLENRVSKSSDNQSESSSAIGPLQVTVRNKLSLAGRETHKSSIQYSKLDYRPKSGCKTTIARSPMKSPSFLVKLDAKKASPSPMKPAGDASVLYSMEKIKMPDPFQPNKEVNSKTSQTALH